MNIGIKTGAIIAHFAEALPINMFMKAERITKHTIRVIPVKPMFFFGPSIRVLKNCLPVTLPVSR